MKRLPPGFVAVGVAIGAVLAIVSSGFHWQDEYAHLLFSRWIWRHPDLVVDIWGRPLVTVAYVPGAAVGLWAVRLTTVVFASLAALWTAQAASERKASPIVAWLSVIGQPVCFSFSFGALPGTLFAALFALFLLQDARGRSLFAAAVVALLPLARVEGLLVAAVYAVALLGRGERLAVVVPFAGVAGWNLLGWAFTGSSAFLLTNSQYPLIGTPYARGGWFYLFRVLPVGAGAVVFILAQLGAFATMRSAGLLHVLALIFGVFLTLVWGVPMFASLATPVYLIGFAPLLALFAADGWKWMRGHPAARWRVVALIVFELCLLLPPPGLPSMTRVLMAAGPPIDRLLLAGALALVGMIVASGVKHPRLLAGGLIVAAGIQLVPVARPVAKDPHQRAAERAAMWCRDHAVGRRVIAIAPDFLWMVGADPFQDWRAPMPPPDARKLAELPPGSIVAWDSTYSPREGRLSLDSLRDAGFAEVETFRDEAVQIRLLERR